MIHRLPVMKVAAKVSLSGWICLALLKTPIEIIAISITDHDHNRFASVQVVFVATSNVLASPGT